MDLRVDVYHHFDDHDDRTGGSSHLHHLEAKLDQALSLLTSMEAQMSALSDAVDALQTRVANDLSNLQQQVTDANQRALDAAANDAADAQTIADLQAQVDASNAEAQAIVDRINAIDPVADFPGVPPDPGADPNPPATNGGDTTNPPEGGQPDQGQPPTNGGDTGATGPNGGDTTPTPDPGQIDPNTGLPVPPGPPVGTDESGQPLPPP